MLGVYAPGDLHATRTAPTGSERRRCTPACDEDVYLTLVSSPNSAGRVTPRRAGQPDDLWLWIGGGVMAIGTILALAPRLHRRSRRVAVRSATPDADQERAGSRPVHPSTTPNRNRSRRSGREAPGSLDRARGRPSCVVVLGVVLALNVGTDPQAEAKTSRLLVGTAPAFDLPTLDGGRVTLRRPRGQARDRQLLEHVVHSVHRGAARARRTSTNEHRDDGDFAMVGIVRDTLLSKAKLAEYVDDRAMGWTIALDAGARAALDFGTRGQPETFAISPSGRDRGLSAQRGRRRPSSRRCSRRRGPRMTRRVWPWVALAAVVVGVLAVVRVAGR